MIQKFRKEFDEACLAVANDTLPCIQETSWQIGAAGRKQIVIRKPLWGNQLNYFANISTVLGYIIVYERNEPNWDWKNRHGNVSPPLSRLMHTLEKRTTRTRHQIERCLFGTITTISRRKPNSNSVAQTLSSSPSLPSTPSSSSALGNKDSNADIFGDSDTDAETKRTSSPARESDKHGTNDNTVVDALKKHKKKRKHDNYGSDSCDDAIVEENLAKVMSKQIDAITKVKVAHRHVYDLLQDLQLTNKRIIELNLPEVSTVDKSPTQLFVTNCTVADLGNLCAAKLGLGDGNRFELYPKHVTCIIGAQNLLAELILALSTAAVFQYVTTFTFLVPQGGTIDHYNQELTKRFWQQVQICEANYSESGTSDVRKVLVN